VDEESIRFLTDYFLNWILSGKKERLVKTDKIELDGELLAFDNCFVPLCAIAQLRLIRIHRRLFHWTSTLLIALGAVISIAASSLSGESAALRLLGLAGIRFLAGFLLFLGILSLLARILINLIGIRCVALELHSGTVFYFRNRHGNSAAQLQGILRQFKDCVQKKGGAVSLNMTWQDCVAGGNAQENPFAAFFQR
jgi:hypothetical protein